MSVRALGSLIVLLAAGNVSGQTASPAIHSGTQLCGAAVIEYFSQGQGEPVVLLPGSGFGVAYLEPLAGALARGGYHALRLNPRGAGNSRGSIDVSYHDRGADVRCVIESLRLGTVHLIGHAYGNAMLSFLQMKASTTSAR